MSALAPAADTHAYSFKRKKQQLQIHLIKCDKWQETVANTVALEERKKKNFLFFFFVSSMKML